MLCVLQGALSMLLLVGAGLFVTSLKNVQSLRLGFDAPHLLWAQPQMRNVVLTAAEREQMRARMLAGARSVHGVSAVSLGGSVPFYQDNGDNLFVPGVDSVQKLGDFIVQPVSPGYFATMGTRIIRGREISSDDRSGSAGAIIISEAVAKAVWPARDAIGQCIKVGADTNPCNRVVGIAENIKMRSLRDDAGLTLYVSADQFPHLADGVFLRASGDAFALAEEIRRTLQRAMPGDAFIRVLPMERVLAPSTRSWRLGALMFTLFGVLALIVAAVGLYSVIAYDVARRSQEMGVRIALGARVTDVVKLVMSDGLGLALIAVVVGGAAALVASRWIGPLLFGTSPTDPFVYGAVSATIIGIAAAASFIPAVRASRADPNGALRAD